MDRFCRYAGFCRQDTIQVAVYQRLVEVVIGQRFVDIRLTMLLMSGSLVGVYLGAYGVKVVGEKYIRLVTCLIILLCVISRAISIPMYLRQLGFLHLDPGLDPWFNNASKYVLFISGISGVIMILIKVFRAYSARKKIHLTLAYSRTAS